MQIRTRYIGPTERSGSKIKAVKVGGGGQLTVAYDFGSTDPHKDVAWALAQRIEPNALRVQMMRMQPTGYIFRVET